MLRHQNKRQDRQCSLVLQRGELEKRKFVNVYLENASSTTAVCETCWISNVLEILTDVINNDDKANTSKFGTNDLVT